MINKTIFFNSIIVNSESKHSKQSYCISILVANLLFLKYILPSPLNNFTLFILTFSMDIYIKKVKYLINKRF